MGSIDYFGASHLSFKKLPIEKGLKLHKYKVINTHYNYEIGEIHWRGGWHQYVFEAQAEIDMSRSCQKEIIKFIDKLMEKRKKKKRRGRNVRS